MTTYESTPKTIFANADVVFRVLSDLKNLDTLRPKIEATGKVKNLVFDTNSCQFVVDMAGQVTFKIVEREEFSTIKFKLENAFLKADACLQLTQIAENETQIKLIIQANLPPMIKMMLGSKLFDSVEKLADSLAEGLNAHLF